MIVRFPGRRQPHLGGEGLVQFPGRCRRAESVARESGIGEAACTGPEPIWAGSSGRPVGIDDAPHGFEPTGTGGVGGEASSQAAPSVIWELLAGG